MENKRLLTSNVFNSQLFERRGADEKEQTQRSDTYTIDGVQVSKEQWTQKQEEAIAADIARLAPRRI